MTAVASRCEPLELATVDPPGTRWAVVLRDWRDGDVEFFRPGPGVSCEVWRFPPGCDVLAGAPEFLRGTSSVVEFFDDPVVAWGLARSLEAVAVVHGS